MVQQIKDETKRGFAAFCERILSSVALTYRPLNLRELGIAADLPEVLSDNLQSVEEVLGRCGSFLTVV
jgi:hypothetical protein